MILFIGCPRSGKRVNLSDKWLVMDQRLIIVSYGIYAVVYQYDDTGFSQNFLKNILAKANYSYSQSPELPSTPLWMIARC